MSILRLSMIFLVLWCLVKSDIAVCQQKNPNIVLIFADDIGYGDLSCYGATHIKTPNIDQLAQQGRRFTDAHSASAVCTPSRYALLTGRYPARNDLWGPLSLRSPLVIDPDRTTMADVAKRAGYATACIGKWHLGWQSEQPTDWNKPLTPGARELGFDYYFGMPTVNSHPPYVFVENDRVVGWDAKDPLVYGQTAETRKFEEKHGLNLIGGAKHAHSLYDDEKVGTAFAKKATAWITQKSKQDAPFFLYLATTNIHHPFTPAEQFQGTSKAGRYGDFIHELDWIVGQVEKSLEENGVADETLVIFTSDNGGMLNKGGQEAYRLGHRQNGELFGFKFDAWEGGHRVPFIVRWPGKVDPGSQSNSLICNIDMLATVAALTKQDLNDDEGPDSVNMLPAFTEAPDTVVRKELLIAPYQPRNLSLRQGDWMYISGRGGGGFTARNVGDHTFGGPAATKFTGQVNSDIADGKIKPDAPQNQLYNLAKDPKQSTNVINDNPEIAIRMKARIAEILAEK